MYCTPRAQQVGEVEERKRVNAWSSGKLSEFDHVPVRAAIFDSSGLGVVRASNLNIGLHNAFCLLLTCILEHRAIFQKIVIITAE